MRRALVCLHFGIGDVVMQLPVLRELRRQWRAVHLTGLGAWPAVQLLEGDGALDELATVQALGFTHWGDEGSPAARRRAREWLAGAGFDVVLDGSHAVVGVQRLLEEAGLPRRDTGRWLQAPAEPPHGRAARSIWESSARAWGLSPPGRCPRPELRLPRAAREHAAALFAAHWPPATEVVALVPVGSSPLKVWPLARMAELGRRLVQRRDAHLLVLGVPEDDAATRAQLGAALPPGRALLLPHLHLQHTAALLERCRALVSNDTGLMHVAAALGVRTVALFGPSSPRVVLPEGATPVESGVPCEHRLLDAFGPPECVVQGRCLVAERSCIESVPVEAVASALFALLPAATPACGAAAGHGAAP